LSPVCHFYNVHFNPSRFPGTLLWWHGRISLQEMLHDHPLEYDKLMAGEKWQLAARRWPMRTPVDQVPADGDRSSIPRRGEF
jgi:hypothetical protein